MGFAVDVSVCGDGMRYGAVGTDDDQSEWSKNDTLDFRTRSPPRQAGLSAYVILTSLIIALIFTKYSIYRTVVAPPFEARWLDRLAGSRRTVEHKGSPSRVVPKAGMVNAKSR